MIRRLKTWLKQLIKSLKRTSICKNCFNETSERSFHELFLIDNYICADCLFNMHPFFKEFKIDGIKGLAIFPYKNKVKDMIYKYKGCNDYEMKFVFLSMFKNELKLRYRDYILIPSPSHKNAYEERGFNHVIETFSLLGLKVEDLLEKTEDISQHNLGFKDRIKVSKIIKLSKKVDLTGKKVLIVDDIVTTGSTIKTSINLVKKLNPKMIEILVVAKTEFTPEEKAKLDENYPILD